MRCVAAKEKGWGQGDETEGGGRDLGWKEGDKRRRRRRRKEDWFGGKREGREG